MLNCKKQITYLDTNKTEMISSHSLIYDETCLMDELTFLDFFLKV